MDDSVYNDFLIGLGGIYHFIRNFAAALESYRDWYQRNSDTVLTYINVFSDFGVWCSAIKKMKDRQIVFTDDLTFELAKSIYCSSDVDTIVQGYYFENSEQRMNALIARCEQADQLTDFKDLFTQIMSAYQRKHYQLACVGLFSLLDGVLSELSLDNSTSFRSRIEQIKNKMAEKIELSDIDKQLWCVYASLDSFDHSIFANANFKKDEPVGLNRHWVIHGRTRKQYTQFDFLKAMLFLDAIIVLTNVGEQIETDEME